MKVDFIIVGQGICGSFLSWYLIKAGKKVIVIDEPQPFSASKVASGIINPVTGRRIVKTWMIDELLPFARNAYTELKKELNSCLINDCNVLDFHPNPQMKDAFEKRLLQKKDYLYKIEDENLWTNYFNYNYGIGEIAPCYLIDLNTLLNKWREKLESLKALLQQHFSWDNCIEKNDAIIYNDITAKKIIFCEGVSGFENPYFKLLPYVKTKGEVIIAEINDLPATNIYKQGISIVPWKNNLFWIGSSYEWNYNDIVPTEIFRKKIEMQLNFWLKLPYKIVEHWAAERPANIERRPFVGFHPLHKNIGILNGMGTKGCSLAPYFAHQLTQHLTKNFQLNSLADINRFARILGK